MTVNVLIPTVFLQYTNGAKNVTAVGATIAELFADLDSRHPGLRARVVTEDNSLRRFVNVYLNDTDVRYEAALQTPVRDGDCVMILPAVAGG